MPPTDDRFKRPSVESDAFPRPTGQRVVPMSHALEPAAPAAPRPAVMLDGVLPTAPQNPISTGLIEPQPNDSLESTPAAPAEYDADALESSEPNITEVNDIEPLHPDHVRLFRYNGLAMAVTGAVLVLILLIGAGTLFLNSRHVNDGQSGPQANDYALGSNLPLGQVKNQLSSLSNDQLEVNGQLTANDSLVVTPTARPANPETGQIYYDRATNQPYYYNGAEFVSLASQPGVTSLGGASGLISVGGGLQVTNGQLALSPSATQALTGAVVNSLQGQTGNVTLGAGNGIGIDGTTISNTGLTGISGTNGIAVSVAGGQVTIGLPQLLGTGDTPSFAGLSLANPLGIASGGTGSNSFNSGGVVYYNGTALVSTPAPGGNGLCLVSSPSGPQFSSCSGGSAVTSLNNLTGALTLQAGAGVTITDNGSNVITISATGATGANVSLSNLSGVAINTDLLPGTTNTVSLGSTAARFKDLWLGGNATVGGTLTVSGTINAATISGGTVSGGTLSGGNVSGGTLTGSAVNGLSVSGTAISGTGALSITAGGTNQNLTLQGAGTGSVVIQTPLFHNANGATYSFNPADNSGVTATICTTVGNCAGTGGGIVGSGTSGFIPLFNGTNPSNSITDSILSQSGTTVTATGTLAATTLQGNGAGVTNVNAVTLQGNNAAYFTNASNISSGTLNDARLSANVALLNGSNNFTGTTLQHNGNDVCDASNNCNYAPAGGGNGYIRNGTSAQTADFNITGNGTMGTLSVTNNAGVGGTLTVTGTINTATISGGTLTATAVNGLSVSGTAISGTGALSITAGGTNQNLTLQGAGTGSVVIQTPLFHNANGATYSFNPADNSGVTATICTTVGNCAGTGGGIIASGTPTAGSIPIFTSSNSIGNSQLSDSGTTLTYTGNMVIQGTNSLSLGTAGPAGKTGSVNFNNATNGNTFTLQAGATASNLAFTLPTADGANGNCLQTNGSGVLSFQSCTGTGPGGGVTSLNGESGVLVLDNASGTTGHVTINNASTLQKGIATFNSHNFKDDGAGTINTIQDIGTGDSPSFAGLTASGTIQGATINATSALQLNGQNINNNGVLNNVAYLGATSQTFTGANAFNGSGIGLTVAHNATVGGSLTVTGQIIAQAATSIQLGTAGSSTGSLLFHNAGGSNTITLQGPLTYPGGSYTLSIPNLAGNDTICTVSTGCGSGGITGGGTGGTIPLYSGTGASTVIGNSILTQSGATVSVGGGLTATGTVQGATLNGTGAIQLNGNDINTANTLNNVAYLNYANNFSQNQTISANSGKTTLALTSTGLNTGVTLGGDTTLYRSTLNTLKTDGTFVVGADLNVSGNSTLSGTLGVTGAGTFTGQVNANGGLAGTNATLSGTLGVTGNTTLTGTLTVNTLGTNGSTPLCSNSGVISSCSGGGGNSFILNGTAAQTANFNITGSGTVGGFTDTGTALFKNTSTSAFQIQNAGGSSNLLIADTQNSLIGIGAQPTIGGATLQVAGGIQASGAITAYSSTGNEVVLGTDCTATTAGICFDGDTTIHRDAAGFLVTDGEFAANSLYATSSLSFATSNLATFVTPLGTSVSTKINIPYFNLGSGEQYIALGLPSGAATSARAIAVFDNRGIGGGLNQPAIGVLSPNESNIFGLSWEASNTTAYLYTTGGGITLQSGTNPLLQLGSTGGATITGNTNTTGVFQVNGIQTIYNAQAMNGFTGSLFVGDGGGSLSHITLNDGYNNSALGFSSLYSNTTGNDNSAVGQNALFSNTTGSANSALGFSSLYSNTTGNNNSALGFGALFSNTTGSNNSALGANALSSNTGGNYNSALGVNAGQYISGGVTANANSTLSLYLGYSTKALANGDTNEIVIGASAVGNGSNTVTLGNSSITGTYLQGNVCIDNTTCTHTLGVTGTIAASGAITASTTPDISETIPASADVTPGDVVSASPDGNVDAARSSVPYDPTTIGVISDGSSSFRINSNGGSEDAPDTGKYLVLAGRVPVHVTDENGPIEPGDYLTTSSTPGYAMKATHAGPTIGKALAAFDGTSGTVIAQTNLSYYGGPTGTDYVQNGGNATLSSLTVGDMTNLADLNTSGTATINNLTVTGSATIATLTVTGSAQFAGDITVGGHIITNGSTPTVQAQAAAGSGATCVVRGNDTGGSITITTGSTDLADGQECLLIFHNDFAGAPNPVIAPRNKTSAQAQAFVGADPHTMTIEFSNVPAASTTYTFSYFNTQ